MLDNMRESIEIALKHRDEIDEPFADTIILAMCRDILNNYILLIPNERNHRDAKALSNIEGAQVLNEAEDIEFGYGLYEVLNAGQNVDEIINHIKRRSIIIKNDEAVIKEFHSAMRVLDEMTGDTGNRYLTRRHLMFRGGSLKTQTGRLIDKYWTETSDIRGVDFTRENMWVLFEKNIDIHLPERTFHERGFLDHLEFYNECKQEMVETMNREKKNKKSFYYDCPFSICDLRIEMKREDAHEYFDMEYSSKFLEEYDVVADVVFAGNHKENIAKWRIRTQISPREFVNRLINHYIE